LASTFVLLRDITRPPRFAVANKIKAFLCFLLLTCLLSGSVVAAPKESTVYTPDGVKDSVYKIVAIQGGENQWSGTAWKLSEGFMMTAGHVCDTAGEDGFTFRVMSRWNKEYPVEVIKFSREPDLCLLSAPHVPGDPMGTLTLTPAYGETIWYSGAPVGVFGDGTVPFAEGVYIGGYKAMIAGYPGASGSAMYTKNGVFGVLVAGYRGTHLIEFVPAWAVAQFLKE
jgi:hypothetical protein